MGQVRGGGSAGPVLRSPGTLGQEELSRGRATGIRMSTFLRSLRPGPAAASWSGPGSVPPIYTKGSSLYYFKKPTSEGECAGGLRGIGPAFAGNVGMSWAFALKARGE